MVPDAELMEAVRNGSVEAFEALLDRFWARLVPYARRLVDHEDSAEDIVQETWIRLWDRRSQWTPDGTVRGYLYRVTRNLALKELEKGRVRRAWAEKEGRVRTPAVPTPAEIAERERVQRVVDAAIQDLPDRRREVFVLARYHGHRNRRFKRPLRGGSKVGRGVWPSKLPRSRGWRSRP